MRKLLMIAVFASLALASGCATVSKTPQETLATYESVIELDLRQLSDDWNSWWLLDRQCRLTKWHVR